MEESLNFTTSPENKKITNIRINFDIIMKINPKNYSTTGKIFWYYTQNSKKISENIEKYSIIRLNTIPICNTKYNKMSSLYSCEFNIDKCHIDFELGARTGKNCELVGYKNTVHFVKCETIKGYSQNVEFNEDAFIYLDLELIDDFNNTNNDFKIHICYCPDHDEIIV
jgi:hypothetical protein